MPDTFFDPVPEIEALEADKEHGLSLAEWAQRLRTLDPEEYFVPEEYGEPCRGLPLSEKKILALRRRVRNGQRLWHPKDMTFDRLMEEVGQKFVTQKNGTLKQVGLKLIENGVPK